MKSKSRSWLDRILLGMAIFIILGYCAWLGRPVFSFVWSVATWLINTNQPNQHVQALLHLPAYQLTYPGAVLLQSSSQGPSWGESGTQNPAEASKTFGVPAPVPTEVSGQAILDWYDYQLQAAGWTPAHNLNNSGAFSAQKAWRKEEDSTSYYLTVEIYDPLVFHQYQPSVDTAKYPLAFQLSIYG